MSDLVILMEVAKEIKKVKQKETVLESPLETQLDFLRVICSVSKKGSLLDRQKAIHWEVSMVNLMGMGLG